MTVTLESVSGVVASFRLPAFTEGRVYLTIPAGAVQSVESGDASEEYHFTNTMYWTYESERRDEG